MPAIQKIFMNNFKTLKSEWKQGEDLTQWKTFDLYHLLEKTFEDVVHVVMLGEDDAEKLPKVGKHSLSHAIDEWITEIYYAFKDPLYYFTFSLNAKLNFGKSFRKVNKLEKSLYEGCIKIIKDRENVTKPGINLIDMMNSWNKECDLGDSNKKELKIDLDSMVGNLIFFYGAGSDTSRSTSTTALQFLSLYPKFKDRIFNEIKDNLSKGNLQAFVNNPEMEIDFNNTPELDMYTKEVLRIYGPSTNIHYRLCEKTHKLNGVTIYKGTKLGFSQVALQCDPEYHEGGK
jgi:cytochrome P450